MLTAWCDFRTFPGMKLAAYLHETGITVPELARKAALWHTTLYRILSGVQVPGPRTRAKIARATGGLVTERDLLRDAAELAAVSASPEKAA
jgi:transcriptional regulator with XRE-family HTH domain